MEISVKPVDNGWIVFDRTGKTSNVFTDREKMMEHLNDIVPETGSEAEFIDNLDAQEDIYDDCDEEEEDFGEELMKTLDELMI